MSIALLADVGLIASLAALLALLDDWRTELRHNRKYGQPYITTTLGELR